MNKILLIILLLSIISLASGFKIKTSWRNSSCTKDDIYYTYDPNPPNYLSWPAGLYPLE